MRPSERPRVPAGYDPRIWMTRREVEVRVWSKLPDGSMSPRVAKIEDSLVLGDLAVCRVGPGLDRWTIVHLPSGLGFSALSCEFDEELKAALALEDVAKLKNGWAALDDVELARLAPQIVKIGRMYSGSWKTAGPVMSQAAFSDDELNVRKEDI